MKGNRATLLFETEAAGVTRSYPARYVADGQYDGFAVLQSASDPMFADMKAGKWAYIQIGEGSDATKLRVSLAGAKRSLGAFLPACSGAAKPARPASTATAAYVCEDGRAITAAYLGNDTDTPVARLTIDGQVVLLAQAISGSGARYEGESSGSRITWLTKADDGFLITASVDDVDGTSEQTTRCSAQ
jgi:membrane-bound inhibitor of C-type lysozyme